MIKSIDWIKLLFYGRKPASHRLLFLALRITGLAIFFLFEHFALMAGYRGDVEAFVILGLQGLLGGVIAVDASVLPINKTARVEPIEIPVVIEPERSPLFEPTTADWMSYPTAQYVYVIQDIDLTHYCKIGRTNNLQRRLGHFSVVLPFQLNVICIIPCRNMVGAETYLHSIFEDKRMRGEWFNLDSKDVQKIHEFALSSNGNGHSEV